MKNVVHDLLNEFSIKMNDRDDSERFDDPRDMESDDEFDFDLSSGEDGEFDDRDRPRGEEGDDLDLDSEYDDFDDDDSEMGSSFDDFPDSLGDVDDDDGEFGGERKVDITDRLKKMLARRGEGEDEMDTEPSPELDLSAIGDFRDRGRRDTRDEFRDSPSPREEDPRRRDAPPPRRREF